MNRKLDEARPILDEEPSVGETDPDYIVIRRHMPATKGKWRLFSKEVEESGGEK